DVDRALSAVDITDHACRSATDRHQSQQNMLVEWVVIGRYVEREGNEHHRLAVWRDVREPVVEIIVGDLLLSASVWSHPPDLHSSASRRVEVDVLAVGRVLRAVVESRRRC